MKVTIDTDNFNTRQLRDWRKQYDGATASYWDFIARIVAQQVADALPPEPLKVGDRVWPRTMDPGGTENPATVYAIRDTKAWIGWPNGLSQIRKLEELVRV